jgi:two-component system sensor histidine kinase HydH
MAPDDVESIKKYVGFDARTSELLSELLPLAKPSFPALVEDFYDAITRDAEARAIVTGGERQFDRLKKTLLDWLESGLRGPHDHDFAASRRRIGLVHVRIGLPQRYMLTAMNRVRAGLLTVAEVSYAPQDPQRRDTLLAIHRLLDLELALMFDSYAAYSSERIRDTERLATIGQLTATIGHELRNPLAVIESSLYLVRQKLQRLGVEDPQLDKHADKIQKQVAQCNRTITHLLDLARDRPPARQRILLESVVQDLIEEIDPRTKVDLAIPHDIDVDVDPDDLGHVLTNLFVNATEAAAGPCHITVSASRVRGGTEIVVQDDGPGVPLDHRAQVFDALFTTKARGTGLGLALCRRIVHAHGGEIELQPAEQGARFRMWFPDVDQEPK